MKLSELLTPAQVLLPLEAEDKWQAIRVLAQGMGRDLAMDNLTGNVRVISGYLSPARVSAVSSYPQETHIVVGECFDGNYFHSGLGNGLKSDADCDIFRCNYQMQGGAPGENLRAKNS